MVDKLGNRIGIERTTTTFTKSKKLNCPKQCMEDHSLK